MKKYIFFLCLLSVSSYIFAQTEYDGLRLSETELKGTARYMSMGGAFGSLGADASALKDNPAGLGVYRSSEIGTTLDLSLYNIAPISWINNTTNQEGKANMLFNNFSYISTKSTENISGLVSSNFSFTYNRLKNYNKSFLVQGGTSGVSFTDYLVKYSGEIPGSISYSNLEMPWLTVLGYNGYLLDTIPGSLSFSPTNTGGTVRPNYQMVQTGALSEFSFGWGGNFSNRLFLGANLNLRSLTYNLASYYAEVFQNGEKFSLANTLTQDGIGVNLKLGAIYLPTDNLRLGVAFHTPTYMSVEENSYADLTSSQIPSNEDNPSLTPVSSQTFNIWNPLQIQLSASYLFGIHGLISAEYDYINYAGSRFNSVKSSLQNFSDINTAMGTVLNNVHVIKLGGELKVTPSFALRAGYSTSSPTVKSDYKDGKILVPNSANTNTEYFNTIYNTNYYTFGFGYRGTNWIIDLGYVLKQQKEEFYPFAYPNEGAALLDNTTHDIILTVSYRM